MPIVVIEATKDDATVQQKAESIMQHVVASTRDWSTGDYMRLLIDLHGHIEAELGAMKER
jgi:hypothetical protein